MPQKKSADAFARSLLAGMFFLYPVSLALNKTMNDVLSLALFLSSCAYLLMRPAMLKTAWAHCRRPWIIALCVPLLLAVLQYLLLPQQLHLRDMDEVSRFVACVPVYLAIVILRPSIRPFLWGCLLFLLATVPLMFWHLHVLGLARGVLPNGFLGIIPHTSLALILGALALALLVQQDGSLRRRWLALPLIGYALAVPLLTQTRSGLLLALCLGALVWMLLPNKRIKGLLYGAVAVLAIIGIVVTNSALWSRSDQTLAEIEHYASADNTAMTSATTRIELWRFAGKMFVAHPLIGVGNHRFQEGLMRYQVAGETPSDLGMFTHPHNEFLKAAAEGGIIGVFSLGLLYFVPLLAARRRYAGAPSAANPALLVIIVSTGFFIAGMVDVVLIWRPTILFYGLVVSLLVAHMDGAGTPAAT
ncbi:O-antigen ligase family protein [Actimicrobium sp. CCC2.4]|uniref:O-antigen ligase family protein n=1 Tax=Actimicrobium sp. CCC2.4 TaxID=3048606 RepID=UPI002AC9A552|nr:O-antigen ligase family protein [Actimicrobium sp. CCC2.4]MEB0134453.1 O-antigen ligase family protein [Actimicrobium sp. CCC2.4]WPX33088.1 O-antigen ligase family protein [Actimicrobium sp. CCC2.4]